MYASLYQSTQYIYIERERERDTTLSLFLCLSLSLHIYIHPVYMFIIVIMGASMSEYLMSLSSSMCCPCAIRVLTRAVYTDGTWMVLGWYADGARMVRGWYADGTRMVRRWHADSTQMLLGTRYLVPNPLLQVLGTRMVCRIDHWADEQAPMRITSKYEYMCIHICTYIYIYIYILLSIYMYIYVI